MARNWTDTEEFRNWFEREIPEDKMNAIRKEAAQVAAKLDELLAESIAPKATAELSISPLETIMLAHYSDRIAEQNEIAARWLLEAKRDRRRKLAMNCFYVGVFLAAVVVASMIARAA